MIDNPPAFPTGSGRVGMDMLDYFAGQALIGLLGNPEFVENSTYEKYAKVAYDMATAMLKERCK